MRTDIQQSFKGLGVALITPFKQDGQIDFTRLAELVNRMIENGVDYLLALGTTSEYPTIAPAEKDDVLRCILETNAKRLPVMVGLGGPNTQFMIRKLEHLALFDVDAILTVTPYYNKPSQAGLIAHYKTFAAATDMPVFLYNVPGRTSCNLELETTLRIAEECPNVVGIKEASGKMKQILQLIAKRPQDFMVISGDLRDGQRFSEESRRYGTPHHATGISGSPQNPPAARPAHRRLLQGGQPRRRESHHVCHGSH